MKPSIEEGRAESIQPSSAGPFSFDRGRKIEFIWQQCRSLFSAGKNFNGAIKRLIPSAKNWVKAGLPDFFDGIYQNGGKYTKLPLNSQMARKYTKWPCYIISHGQKIYQNFPFQGPPKFTPIWIFGFKIYHLATLGQS
jgi:hypothetical protein